jgi:hypothetical protein
MACLVNAVALPHSQETVGGYIGLRHPSNMEMAFDPAPDCRSNLNLHFRIPNQCEHINAMESISPAPHGPIILEAEQEAREAKDRVLLLYPLACLRCRLSCFGLPSRKPTTSFSHQCQSSHIGSYGALYIQHMVLGPLRWLYSHPHQKLKE